MTKPAASYPSAVLPSYQEIGTGMDVAGVIQQIADVVLTGTYAASGAITITVTGAFASWPAYGYIQNLTTNEVIFYNSKTNDALTVLATGRAIQGSATAGGIGQSIRFLESRVLGKAINQLFAEITALETELGINPSGSYTDVAERLTELADLDVKVQADSDGSAGFLNAVMNTSEFEAFSHKIRLKDDGINPAKIACSSIGDALLAAATAFAAKQAIGFDVFTVEDHIEASGDPHIITAEDVWKILTNRGATEYNYHTLPAAAAGLGPFIFFCVDSDGIRADAQAGDTIRVGAGISGSGGNVTSTTIGSALILVALNDSEWVAIASLGTWNCSA